MARKLYKASEIAYILGISRQALDKAIKSGRIEKNKYVTDNVRGWTAEQVERIRLNFKREDKQ